MIEYLIGVDGGGTGTRVRMARADGVELAQGFSGPSALAHGIGAAWSAIGDGVANACSSIGIGQPPLARCAIGLGLAGVHNKQWAAQFVAADPGYAALLLATDAMTTLLGAHQGRPGTIVAVGTGSVGQALLPSGEQREVGGWGFPGGDEASGAWMGLRAITHIEKVVDGRFPSTPFAREVIAACGGNRDAIQVWLGQAIQTSYATLAPIVVAHAASDDVAHAILCAAGAEVACLARALDPSGTLPMALCGGLAASLQPYLPAELLARCVPARDDAASGALRMIRQHLRRAE